MRRDDGHYVVDGLVDAGWGWDYDIRRSLFYFLRFILGFAVDIISPGWTGGGKGAFCMSVRLWVFIHVHCFGSFI